MSLDRDNQKDKDKCKKKGSAKGCNKGDASGKGKPYGSLRQNHLPRSAADLLGLMLNTVPPEALRVAVAIWAHHGRRKQQVAQAWVIMGTEKPKLEPMLGAIMVLESPGFGPSWIEAMALPSAHHNL